MDCETLTDRNLLGSSKLIRGATWTFLILLLLSLYGRWLMEATPEPLHLAWWILGPFLMLTDFLNLTLYSQFWFFIFWVTGLSLCGLHWLWGRKGWRSRVVSISILGVVLAAPLAVTQMYDQYQLRSVKLAQGYELVWLTEPEGRFASAFKSAQREHDVKGCSFQLHGWSRDNLLFFSSECSNNLWTYSPQSGGKPQSSQHLPTGPGSLTAVTFTKHTRSSGKDGLWVTKVVGESLSPDGRSRAAVIQDSFYGPFDIIVMQQSAPE